MPKSDDTEPDAGVLARRLNALFARHGVTNTEVAKAITAAGTPITHSSISALRRGTRRAVDATHLAAIAEYFKLPINFFTDPDPGYQDAEVKDVFAIADAERIYAIARHASGLSPESQELVLALIDKARQAERLPPVDGGTTNTT